jgi:hypothetical protein
LDSLINDPVANAQSVEVEGHTRDGAVANKLVVLVEERKEARAVVLY